MHDLLRFIMMLFVVGDGSLMQLFDDMAAHDQPNHDWTIQSLTWMRIAVEVRRLRLAGCVCWTLLRTLLSFSLLFTDNHER